MSSTARQEAEASHDGHRQRLSALLAGTTGDQVSKKSGLRHSTAATAQTSSASPFDLAKNSKSVVATSLFSQSRLPCFSEAIETQETPETEVNNSSLPDDEAIEEKPVSAAFN